MSRVVILQEWEPLMPIYFPGVVLLEIYRSSGKVGFARKAFNGKIPESAHVMKAMDNEEEMNNAVCNVCMKKKAEWVCVNSEHVPIEPLGFHLCNICYLRINDKVAPQRIPVAEVV